MEGCSMAIWPDSDCVMITKYRTFAAWLQADLLQKWVLHQGSVSIGDPGTRLPTRHWLRSIRCVGAPYRLMRGCTSRLTDGTLGYPASQSWLSSDSSIVIAALNYFACSLAANVRYCESNAWIRLIPLSNQWLRLLPNDASNHPVAIDRGVVHNLTRPQNGDVGKFLSTLSQIGYKFQNVIFLWKLMKSSWARIAMSQGHFSYKNVIIKTVIAERANQHW